jgi:hypothetical protein
MTRKRFGLSDVQCARRLQADIRQMALAATRKTCSSIDPLSIGTLVWWQIPAGESL